MKVGTIERFASQPRVKDLTVTDAVERLQGVRLVRLGEAELGLWRLADAYPAAQMEVLAVLPKLAAPMLARGKANVRRLRNARKGRPLESSCFGICGN